MESFTRKTNAKHTSIPCVPSAESFMIVLRVCLDWHTFQYCGGCCFSSRTRIAASNKSCSIWESKLKYAYRDIYIKASFYLNFPSSIKNKISSIRLTKFRFFFGIQMTWKCKASSNISTVLDGNAVKSNVNWLLNFWRALIWKLNKTWNFVKSQAVSKL